MVFIDQSPPRRLSPPRRRLIGKGIRNAPRWQLRSTAFISGLEFGSDLARGNI
jgi:hypothetical protein